MTLSADKEITVLIAGKHTSQGWNSIRKPVGGQNIISIAGTVRQHGNLQYPVTLRLFLYRHFITPCNKDNLTALATTLYFFKPRQATSLFRGSDDIVGIHPAQYWTRLHPDERRGNPVSYHWSQPLSRTPPFSKRASAETSSGRSLEQL